MIVIASDLLAIAFGVALLLCNKPLALRHVTSFL